MKLFFKTRNRKGISGVVAAVLMIALVMVVAVIVWVVVRNIVQGQIGSVESCFDVFGKVEINPQYTCYDSTSDEFRFSINVGDINVTKVIVSISSEGSTNSYELSSEDNIDLESYPAGSEVLVPGKNSGRTYIAESMTSKPDTIQIAPVIGTQQCEVADSFSEIEECI